MDNHWNEPTVATEGATDGAPAAERRAARLRRTGPAFALAVGAVAVFVLACWSGGAALQSMWPAVFVMKPNTAASLLLLAAALLGVWRHTGAWRVTSYAGAVGAILLSSLTIAEYVFRADLHIDRLLFPDRAAILFPGRTSPGTACCFLLIGVALLLIDLRRGTRAVQVLLFMAAAAPLAALGGYLYRAPGLSPTTKVPVIALHTAVCQSLLCLGALFVRPEAGLMRVVVSESLAGAVARKLLPLAVAVPMTVGLLVLLGERLGIYGVEFGSALLVACCALFFAAAVWLTTSLLWKTETARAAAELRLEAQRQHLLAVERSAREEAERLGRVKDEFLATLGHELRTPLNAILGWSQLLSAGGGSPDDAAEGLASIVRNARAQSRIIEDLLDMGRIVSGKLRLDVQRVRLDAVLTAAVETLQPAAAAKGVRLQAVLDPLAGPVSGDPDRLQQVFWNLLSNAVKFTPRGGRVQVLLERVNSHLEVGVTDTGEGIAPEFLPHVFDRFSQSDASTTRRHGGLGLGLAIVKQLVELHGGSVRAESAGEGRGSAFVVSLPLTVVRAEPEAPAERRHPTANEQTFEAPGCAELAGMKVLVVDDERDAGALVKRWLERCGAVVAVAGSAPEAMECLRAERPDVLVSDIGMPGEDGYAFLRRLRALPPGRGGDTPAVALTAYARAEDRVRAVKVGFQHHVAKPVNPAELVAMIASLKRRDRS